MDRRFVLEMDEINAAALRWRNERDQATVVGQPADPLDEAAAEIVLRVDDARVTPNILIRVSGVPPVPR